MAGRFGTALTCDLGLRPPATSNSSEDPHWGVTRHYGVPVISFVHGALPACGGADYAPKEYDAALEQHWRAGCGELDEVTEQTTRGLRSPPRAHHTRDICSAHHALYPQPRHLCCAVAADTAASCGSSFLAAFAGAARPPTGRKFKVFSIVTC